jgi:hypothetical protein
MHGTALQSASARFILTLEGRDLKTRLREHRESSNGIDSRISTEGEQLRENMARVRLDSTGLAKRLCQDNRITKSARV